jgi:hypothetical protein
MSGTLAINKAGCNELAIKTSGNNPAIPILMTGIDCAGAFQINNASNGSNALYAATNGSGDTVYGATPGNGNAVCGYTTRSSVAVTPPN